MENIKEIKDKLIECYEESYLDTVNTEKLFKEDYQNFKSIVYRINKGEVMLISNAVLLMGQIMMKNPLVKENYDKLMDDCKSEIGLSATNFTFDLQVKSFDISIEILKEYFGKLKKDIMRIIDSIKFETDALLNVPKGLTKLNNMNDEEAQAFILYKDYLIVKINERRMKELLPTKKIDKSLISSKIVANRQPIIIETSYEEEQVVLSDESKNLFNSLKSLQITGDFVDIVLHLIQYTSSAILEEVSNQIASELYEYEEMLNTKIFTLEEVKHEVALLNNLKAILSQRIEELEDNTTFGGR